MNGQMSIDEILPVAHARRTDPDTSHTAAERVSRATMTAVQTRVLRIASVVHGFTDEWLAAAWDSYGAAWGTVPVSPSGLRTRRAELVDAALLEDSGARDRTVTGRPCIVWVITPKGLERTGR